MHKQSAPIHSEFPLLIYTNGCVLYYILSKKLKMHFGHCVNVYNREQLPLATGPFEVQFPESLELLAEYMSVK